MSFCIKFLFLGQYFPYIRSMDYLRKKVNRAIVGNLRKNWRRKRRRRVQVAEEVVVAAAVEELMAEQLPKLPRISSLVVLKPVENILALNLAIERKVGSDLLYLGGIGGPDPTSSVHLLQDHHLLWGWTPPC